MPAIKTAVSIDEVLFEQAKELARLMNVSRSKLISLALDEFVRKHQEEDMIRRINESCVGLPDEQEKEFLRLANANSVKFTENDEW